VLSPRDHDDRSAEALIAALARAGDRDAFAELVRRRQSWIRNMMRRYCGDAALAEELAQQVFLQAWRNIRRLREPAGFGGWLKRLAVTTWLQHLRKHDALRNADEYDDTFAVPPEPVALAMDLNGALATLPDAVRLCVILFHHDGMTHEEIVDLSGLPLGTVKSHIRRGTTRLQNLLSDYKHRTSYAENSS
jgi:RNA polymerase sigma-70 factor (ECF subfamily)